MPTHTPPPGSARRTSAILSAALAGSVLAVFPSVRAEDYYYWDVNGSIAGAGVTPSGLWDLSTANWSKTSVFPNPAATVDGTSPTTTYSGTQTAGTAFFSAGSDAIGSYTVTIDSTAGTIWSKTLTVQEGAVNFAGTGTAPALSLGSNSVLTVAAGASATFDSSLTIKLSGAGTFSLANDSATLLTVNSAINTGSARTWTMTGSGSGGTTINGVISSSGGIAVNTTNGVTTITGANTYTGKTTLSAGVLSVETIANGGSVSNIGKSSNAAANLVFDGGILRYTGATTTSNRAFAINNEKTATIEVSGSTASLTLAGATSTATTGAFNKSGTGKLVLSGVNTYTGATTISAGTLALGTGASLASTELSIANGAIFDVSATTGAYDLTSISTTIYLAETNVSGFINAGSNALLLGNALTLNFTTSELGTSAFYDLFASSGTTDNFSSVTFAGSFAGSLTRDGSLWSGYDSSNLYHFSFDQSSGELTVSAIPEPSTYAAIAGALALGAVAWRRRRPDA